MRNRYLVLKYAILMLTPLTGFTLSSCRSDRPDTETDIESSICIETSEALDPKKCGTFVGIIYKQHNGDIISGAEITAQNVKTEEVYSARTKLNGQFELMVPKGTYTLQITADGFCKYTSEPYKVKSGENVQIEPPIQLITAGHGSSFIGPEYDESAVNINAEASSGAAEAPEQAIRYVDSDDAYGAFLNDILARSEYRGFDGKAADGYSTMIDYVRYDMNRDGVDELIVNTGSCEADRVISFYTIRNNTVELIGSGFSGFHVYSYITDPSSGQFVTEWAHQGYGGATWFLFDGNTLQTTREIGPTAYQDTASLHFVEKCTELEMKSGYKQDSKWIFEKFPL